MSDVLKLKSKLLETRKAIGINDGVNTIERNPLGS